MEIEELLTEPTCAWNVPLLQYLDTYMKNVLEPVSEVDRPDLNFVKAGMIIERTTSVFSDKVRKLLNIAYGSNDEEEKVSRKREEQVWVSDGLLIDFDIDVGESTSFCRSAPNKDVSTFKETPWQLRFDGQDQVLLRKAPDQVTGAIVLTERQHEDPSMSVHSSPLAFADGHEPVMLEVPPPELDFGSDEEMFPMLDPNERHPEMERPFQKMTSMRIPKSFKKERQAIQVPRVNSNTPFITVILKSLSRQNERCAERELTGNEEAGLYDDVEIPPAPLPEESIRTTEMDRSYEDACRLSVQTMIDDGRQRVVDLDRAERLAAWEREIEQVISKQDTVFDIGTLKGQILEWLHRVGGTSSFKVLTSQLPSHKVSRAFLTLLVLANEGYITISDEFEGDFRITLT